MPVPTRSADSRIADFEADLDRMVAGLTKDRLHLAAQIAAVPQQIRGFGHVKDASVGPAKAEATRLWGEWEKVSVKETVAV